MKTANTHCHGRKGMETNSVLYIILYSTVASQFLVAIAHCNPSHDYSIGTADSHVLHVVMRPCISNTVIM